MINDKALAETTTGTTDSSALTPPAAVDGTAIDGAAVSTRLV